MAILDDNGDGLGTPGDWFVGTRANRQSKTGELDGRAASKIILVSRGTEALWTAEQRKKRDQLEAQVEQLRNQKATLAEDGYYLQLETILLELSRLSSEVESGQSAENNNRTSEIKETEGSNDGP